LTISKTHFTFDKNDVMNIPLLLHHRFKRMGWCLLIPATIVGIFLAANGFNKEWLNMHVFAFWYDKGIFSNGGAFDWVEVKAGNTLVAVIWLIGALMVGFSKEKLEDEFIANLRLSSLLWSVWINYLLLLVSYIFIYGFPFLNVMLYNMFTILIIFIARFNFILYRSSKMVPDEK